MQVFGIELKNPGFWGLTRATAMGVAFWSLLVSIHFHSDTPQDAGAVLVGLVTSQLAYESGVRALAGLNHFAALFLAVLLSLALYVGVCLAWYSLR